METSLKDDIRILPDPESLAHAAATIFADAAKQAIAAHDRFSVALSGGSTPRQLFRILGSDYRNSIRWDSVHLFWTDERAVPPQHEQSNYRLAHDELISKVAIPYNNIHRIQGELAPSGAAKEYEKELRHHFGDHDIPVFDLILLGLGQDGHTASLFPESEALLEKDHLVAPSYSKSADNWRVTLTLPVLNNAANIVFLIAGKSKVSIINEIFSRGRGHLYPAGQINPAKGHITWLLDRESASELQR
ncbi:MAG: 6-phosphogluconolactonase [Nitrospirae bacterium]|nr:6-phosphogluconolactonase [Nitrospirota bacterium]